MTGVMLSSTKAEYVSMPEAVKELKLIHMCLTYLGFHIELPMLVYIDNVGAINLLHKQSTNCCTKPIGI